MVNVFVLVVFCTLLQALLRNPWVKETLGKLIYTVLVVKKKA